MNRFVIETRGLTKKLGKKYAVSELDLQIGKGEIYGFLGPNGAGKTTTIRMLLGLIRPTKGEIRLFGKDLRKEKIAVLRKMGSLVEAPSYYGHLNAYENLEAIRLILGVPKSRIDEVLSVVRLTKEAGRPVKGYSLGMKQRLGIAAAMLGRPELLILDEPTNGLDPSGILEIRELIKKMPELYGMTVLVSSHLLSEIEQMATRVGIISHGRMIFQDTIEALRKQSERHIRFDVSDPAAAGRLVRSQGLRAELAEDRQRLLIEPVPDKSVAAMIRLLVDNDIDIYRVQEENKSLEDLFLSLTGGEGGL